MTTRRLLRTAAAGLVLALATAGCSTTATQADKSQAGRARSQGRRDTDRHAGDPDPRRPRLDGHREAGRRQAAARAGAAGPAGDADAVHPVGSVRRRHRRLPVLRARPAPRRGRLHHRAEHPARAAEGGAPRDPVPGAAVARCRPWRPRTAPTRGRGGPASAAPAWRTTGGSTTRPGWGPGPPAGPSRCWPRTSASRSRRARGSSCRCTTTCSPGRGRTSPRPSCGWPRRPSGSPPWRRCCCPRRWSCPAAPAGTAAGSATAPPPSRTPSAASGTRWGWSRTTCTCCADRCGPARCRPATGRCRRRRRSGPPPATCTCSAGRSRSRWTRARPAPGPSWTSASGTSTTRAPSRSGRCTCAGRHRAGHLPARPVAARPAAGVQGPARAVRRVGRGHHRRDVPGILLVTRP